MPSRFAFPPSGRIPVVLSTRTLLSYISTWRAAGLALVELGAVAFFASGIAEDLVGPSAPWFVLGAVFVGILLRAVDVESRGLFVPGGLYGTVRDGLGARPARVAAAALVVDRLFLGPLAAVVAGRYIARFLDAMVGLNTAATGFVAEDLSTAIALAMLACVWWAQRRGHWFSAETVSRLMLGIVGVLAVAVLWGTGTAMWRGAQPIPVPDVPRTFGSVFALVVVWGRVLFVVGGTDALAQVAPELAQPRIQNLRRTAVLVGVYALAITTLVGFVVAAVMSNGDRSAWRDAPLAGLMLHVMGPAWLRAIYAVLIVLAAVLLLTMTARASMAGAQSALSRLVEQGLLGRALRAPHPRFGTQWRLVDAIGLAQVAIVAVAGSRPGWLVGAYAVGVAWSAALKAVALIRFRRLRPEGRAFRTPMNVKVAGREWPIGLSLAALLLAVPSACVLAARDAGAWAGAALVLGVTVALTVARERSVETAEGPALDEFQLLPSDDVDLLHVDARPGNLLVPVRKPHAMTHLAAALRAAGDRDVVVMTARLVGVDVPDDPSVTPRATDDERHLLSAVMAEAERHGRTVRLLIAPAANVFDAIIETAVRLQSSEIHCGESETLSADDQARLLGEAWERTPEPRTLDVHLVVHHPSGRTASYHIGAHAPSLSAADLDLIHHLWLDVAKIVGPHVHHRDVVRASLKLMSEHLDGPDRDRALRLLREVARPADELAAVIRARDFGRLREMVRNHPAGDIAALLTDLAVEDQVLVFRTLPRKTAASTFEYLSPEAQETLLKAMAQEDVAALLSDMAPDDRTMFLEELPARATQQLLALLTPEERAVAVNLLGYPEASIGRRMTPHYIAVHEDWTVQGVLDYIRTHGQDSETMNVIYVVDDQSVLIDDIRIRELLLSDPAAHVRDLMDRRFVALKAADDQETAVAAFKREDRSALPVTDSAGVLIGIVTVDDVLDVAEAEATEDIQRFGGSEALDEPYMRIAFTRMIQKRAGWLTALFLGEMLTATAMGFFEKEIAKAVVLALFVPLIISSGGNSGSQASTLVIRALALGEVKLIDWWKVMRREIGAGLALGSILGTIGFLRIAIWSAFSTLYGEHWLLVALTVSISLVGVVLWGTLTGSLLPFLLRRLGFDPAASSAPFVATLVDVTGLIIYFSVGLVILRGTLL